MGDLVQKLQGVRTTKHNPPQPSSPEEPLPQVRSNELYLQVMTTSKLYTDDKYRFLVHVCSGHQDVMITYQCDANIILAVPFNTRKDTHRLKAYDKLMQRLNNHKLNADLQIIDNEDSSEYKRFSKKK